MLDIPDVCFPLLQALDTGGGVVPYADLPEDLRDDDLLFLCEDRGLILPVLWDEGTPTEIEPGFISVGTSPGWLTIYEMCRESLAESIERDADHDDPQQRLHLKLMAAGKSGLVEWRLAPARTNNKAKSHPGYASTSEVLSDPRFRKNDKNPPKTTIDQWLDSYKKEYGTDECEGHPIMDRFKGSRENHYWVDWLDLQIAEWVPRQLRQQPSN